MFAVRPCVGVEPCNQTVGLKKGLANDCYNDVHEPPKNACPLYKPDTSFESYDPIFIFNIYISMLVGSLSYSSV